MLLGIVHTHVRQTLCGCLKISACQDAPLPPFKTFLGRGIMVPMPFCPFQNVFGKEHHGTGAPLPPFEAFLGRGITVLMSLCPFQNVFGKGHHGTDAPLPL
jgi:hypothetical protein